MRKFWLGLCGALLAANGLYWFPVAGYSMGANIVAKTGKAVAKSASEAKALTGAKLGAISLTDFDGPVYWSSVSARVAARAAQCAAQGRAESRCNHEKEETEQCIKTRYAGTLEENSDEHDPKLLAVLESCERDYPKVYKMALFPAVKDADLVSWSEVGNRLVEAKSRCNASGVSDVRCDHWDERVRTCLTIHYPRRIDYQSRENDDMVTNVVLRCDRPLPWAF